MHKEIITYNILNNAICIYCICIFRESEKKPAMDQAMRDALKKHIVREIRFIDV